MGHRTFIANPPILDRRFTTMVEREHWGPARFFETPKRRIETGERLDAAPKSRKGLCYFCARPAVVWMAASVPSCMTCHERYRRRD